MTDNNGTAKTVSVEEALVELEELFGKESVEALRRIINRVGESIVATHIEDAILEGKEPNPQDVVQGITEARAVVELFSGVIRSFRKGEVEEDGTAANLAQEFSVAVRAILTGGKSEGERVAQVLASLLASMVEVLTNPPEVIGDGEYVESMEDRLHSVGTILAAAAMGALLMEKDRDPETLSEGEKAIRFLRYLHSEYELEKEGDVDACAVTEDLYNFMSQILGWKIG